MQVRSKGIFTSIKTEGALLPPDLLQRIQARSAGLEGVEPKAYGLAAGERINEAINRSWGRLKAAWDGFKIALEKLDTHNPATGLTRDRWLLILFQELGYGKLLTARAQDIGGKTYPVSHVWQHTPIHLVGFRLELDERSAGTAGAARMSPHSMMQEFLNRSENHLWGLVSNGKILRVLRDNISLTRQAYLEFDLESMMEGDVYSDFVLLWMLCHQSRFEADKPENCWIEKWSQTAREQGTRALEQLREGVKEAISTLGKGFLSNPANNRLKEQLRSGELSTQDFYRQLLRLVYRMIFLFAAEDRGLLLDPNASPRAKDIYITHYSTARIRQLAVRRHGSKHIDLYRGLRVVMEKLAMGYPDLGLPALGSFLWSNQAVEDIGSCDLSNNHLLSAIRSLTVIVESNVRRAVDYKQLGTEELGSVYESLLEMQPDLNLESGMFQLRAVGGSERKTTGSYYTPAVLINSLLDSALDPVVDEAIKSPEPEDAILNLKVCDPACGSGHFLLAAAHRLAKRLASVRTGDDEPAPKEQRRALRDVIGKCIYGVDINEMAVELCKISLWMEALEPGKPLSFLDHRIQVGNSLIGATPKLLKEGIPNAAFNPIEGDDKDFCQAAKAKNRQLEKEDLPQIDWLHEIAETSVKYIVGSFESLDEIPDETLQGVEQKAQEYNKVVNSPDYVNAKLIADAWCAAFVWKKTDELRYPITRDIFRNIEHNPDRVAGWMGDEITRLSEEYTFFHWHLAFPDIFKLPAPDEAAENFDTGWDGGFDVVLGNPPWERVKLQEKEWFTGRRPDIATATNAAIRKRLINALKTEDPDLYEAFIVARRRAEGMSHFARNSGRFPLCGRGDVNTYAVFAEHKRAVLNATGRVGCIVPSGIAFDDTTKFFFQDIMENSLLVSLYDFENRKAIFPGVHRSYKFCLLTLSGSQRPVTSGTEFVFFALAVEDLREADRRITLSAEDIKLINPNTRTCPIFRSRRDAEIAKKIYREVPVLIKEGPPEENPWRISFMRMFDMSNDSHLFKTHDDLASSGWELSGNIFHKGDKRYLPLYEAKMIHQYDHRWATCDKLGDFVEISEMGKKNFNQVAIPLFWVPEGEVETKYGLTPWMLCFRGITNTTNERTIIATIVPRSGVGNSAPVINLKSRSAVEAAFLVGILSSYAFDYVSRLKVGGTNLNFYLLKQLPVLQPKVFAGRTPWEQSITLGEWLLSRVLELLYTCSDLEMFAEECGLTGLPYEWSSERRFELSCEINAAFFYLYNLTLDEAGYIMETFPIVKRKDTAAYGKYRTKHQILEVLKSLQGS